MLPDCGLVPVTEAAKSKAMDKGGNCWSSKLTFFRVEFFPVTCLCFLFARTS